MIDMKCNNCEHQLVCYIYKDYILKLKELNLDITINSCKEFDEVK